MNTAHAPANRAHANPKKIAISHSNNATSHTRSRFWQTWRWLAIRKTSLGAFGGRTTNCVCLKYHTNIKIEDRPRQSTRVKTDKRIFFKIIGRVCITDNFPKNGNTHTRLKMTTDAESLQDDQFIKLIEFKTSKVIPPELLRQGCRHPWR